MENESSAGGPRRWPIVVGIVLAASIVVGLFLASSWQSGVADSRKDEAKSSTATASLLQAAVTEGQAAAQLVRGYVESGDLSAIPQIQDHANKGVENLSKAVAAGGTADLDKIVLSGAGLAEGVGQIVALRQSGDPAGAAGALEQLRPQSEGLFQDLDTAIQTEQDHAASLQSSAKTADDAASWLMLGAIGVGAGAGLAFLVLVGRSLFRRRATGTAYTG